MPKSASQRKTEWKERLTPQEEEAIRAKDAERKRRKRTEIKQNVAIQLLESQANERKDFFKAQKGMNKMQLNAQMDLNKILCKAQKDVNKMQFKAGAGVRKLVAEMIETTVVDNQPEVEDKMAGLKDENAGLKDEMANLKDYIAQLERLGPNNKRSRDDEGMGGPYGKRPREY